MSGHSLFLAIDVPAHVSQRGDRTHTAIPRDFLAHVRAATGMTINNGSNVIPPSLNGRQKRLDVSLSSKVQALLRDLPAGEHSVVFSSSKEGVLHLATVMKAMGIECWSLFVGQKAATSQESVSAWQNAALHSSRPGPVLIVQAGAAASGLTLTAASKMFLMEPFSRQEEEQQAYARCHRYSQTKNVDVKVYFTPVSVESRLLCWRNRAAARMADASQNTGAHYVFKDLFEEDGDATGEDDEASVDAGKIGESEEGLEENRRNEFLLGLIDEQGRPIGVEDGVANDETDDGSREDSRKVSARKFVLG